MDEPLSAIDDKNIQEVIQIILKLTKDKTLIIISHNDKIQPVITREISVCE
jgi:energy-coupling factor transporter ATP-binding protein EcfA2